jgi:hypothetical protein
VDTGVAAAGPDVALEGGPLRGVEDGVVAAVGVVEDHRVEPGEAPVGEQRRVVGDRDVEVVLQKPLTLEKTRTENRAWAEACGVATKVPRTRARTNAMT